MSRVNKKRFWFGFAVVVQLILVILTFCIHWKIGLIFLLNNIFMSLASKNVFIYFKNREQLKDLIKEEAEDLIYG